MLRPNAPTHLVPSTRRFGKANPTAVRTVVDPHPSDNFNASQLELARDLITKEQQIEYLISILPGLLNSEQDQDRTIKELEDELKVAELQRQAAVREKEVTMKKLDDVIRSIRRP